MNSHDIKPDGELTPDQIKLVEKLTETEVQAIDKALLENATNKWQKVAKVVVETMLEVPEKIEGVPDLYYSQRIKRLVDNGKLESQGDLAYMRYSEIRRSGGNET